MLFGSEADKQQFAEPLPAGAVSMGEDAEGIARRPPAIGRRRAAVGSQKFFLSGHFLSQFQISNMPMGKLLQNSFSLLTVPTFSTKTPLGGWEKRCEM